MTSGSTAVKSRWEIHAPKPLIGEWEAAYSLKEDRIRHIFIELPRWLYRAITNFEVLTLHRNYFRLDGGLERRIYELCRKHCGHQPTWSIGLELLYKKSGSRAPVRNFRHAVKELAKKDPVWSKNSNV